MNQTTKATEAAQLRARGLTYRDIAELLEVSHTTVARWLNPEYKIQQRKYPRNPSVEATKRKLNRIQEKRHAVLTPKHRNMLRFNAALRELTDNIPERNSIRRRWRLLNDPAYRERTLELSRRSRRKIRKQRMRTDLASLELILNQ